MRTIEQLVQQFGALDATNCSSEEAISQRILGDLLGYRGNSSHRREDVEFLGNALQAYARLLQIHGVKA